MPLYAWRNKMTGEVIEENRSMSEANIPPDDTGHWERVYSFGVGTVQGGGGSKARQSVRKK